MLYQAERHLSLEEETWDPGVASAKISELLANCVTGFNENGFWRLLDDDEKTDIPATNIYYGAMGVLWAIDYLEQYLDVSLPFGKTELAEKISQVYYRSEATRYARYGIDNEILPSYWLGESGVLLVKDRLGAGDAGENRDRLFQLVQRNMTNPTLEPLWGGTGTLIPLLFMLEATSGQRWQDELLAHGEFMKVALVRDRKFDCPVWIQDLYGEKRRLTGAGHGFVGNMYPFVRGLKFLPETLAQWVLSDTVETVIKTATVEGECSNWPSSLEGPDRGRPPFLLQWCHGAPGVVISLNGVPGGYSQEFDELMVKAGETIWQAGPLTKGVGLCHGTDGNGYALLKLYRRTGDQRWLQRARAFAMFALHQVKQDHSLWEGNMGLACYLHACITEDDRFPLLDIC